MPDPLWRKAIKWARRCGFSVAEFVRRCLSEHGEETAQKYGGKK